MRLFSAMSSSSLFAPCGSLNSSLHTSNTWKRPASRMDAEVDPTAEQDGMF